MRAKLRCAIFALGLIRLFAVSAHAQGDLSIYTDSLQNGWQNYGWAALNYACTNPVYSGADSISVSCGAYQALYVHHAAFDSSPYTNLTFWINGGATGGQSLQVQATLNGTAQAPYSLTSPAPNAWSQVSIPLTALSVANTTDLDGFWIQNQTGGNLPVFYVDDIVLQAGAPPGPPSTNFITVDAAANRHAISSDIYGLAYASTAQLTDLNSPLNRLGGNNTSRYNWQVNADNRAADYYFESIGYPSAVAGEVADTFIATAKAAGAQALVTIPMLDWVAKLGPGRAKLAGFSIAKYGPQSGHDPYFADAGTGVKTNGQNIVGNDPNDANVPANSLFQQAWFPHLTNQWGLATNGGLRYYILDNEPSIWQSTHRDVHPTGATMDEMIGKIVDYAAKIKVVDPGALVVGPEEWGWSGYFYSGYDQQVAATNGYTSFPDRAAHGGADYLPWLLTQLYLTNQATGQRLLDVFSVHYYPQGGEFGTNVSTSIQLLRNKSTRSLWDPNYVDSSWINASVQLIPRLNAWVATNYPGTRTALTEYNWGAESSLNGATAQADILGIFGREGLDIATRWTTPAGNSPAYNAIKMYRNYDSQKSTFGDTSVSANGPNPDNMSVFAAQRSSDGSLTVIVINKQLSGTNPVVITLTNFAGTGSAQAWQINSTDGIVRLPDISYQSNTVTNSLVAPSITLFVFAPRPLRLQPGAPRADGQFELWLNGETGLNYLLQSSIDLMNWSPLTTDMLASPQQSLLLSKPVAARTFFCGVRMP